jgi:hypothetical protein
MQLCLDFDCTLQELNQRMSSAEFTLWCSLQQQQPRGVVRDNFHAALIAVLIANTHAPKGKTFKIDDFMHEDPETRKNREFQGFIARMRALSKPKATE